MTTIVTRAGKGSPLTHNEVDNNFTNLNTDKTENSSAAITGGTINNTTIGGTTPAAGTFTTLTANSTFQAGKGSANYIQGVGAATTLEPVISVIGSDTNVPLAIKTQGTGAIDLAPGSGGVNLSNGGTVTAITRTSAGTGYTSVPNITVSAPTTAGGVQATASLSVMIANAATIASGGTGYAVNDVVTLTGGTPVVAATFTVTAVSGGVVTSVSSTNFGTYSVLPSNPVSVTGGSGTGLTLNVTWAVGTTYTITNAGSGYVEQPTVSFSGGGGSGAAAYATVGSIPTIKTVSSALTFAGPGSGEVFRITDTSSTGAYVNVFNTGGSAVCRFVTSTSGAVQTSTGVPIQFQTNTASASAEQLRISHTASAVNYVQVTGAATGARPAISAQGSDSAINMQYDSKSTGYHVFRTNGVFQFVVLNTTGAVNYTRTTGSLTGAAPSFSVEGSDTNIDLALQAKGTGYVKVNAGTGLGYGTGTGGAVTQATSRTTGVTLNFPTGAITLVSAAGTTAWQSFTVTNSAVVATDTIIVNQKSGTDLYQIFVTNVAAGSFKISFATTGGTTVEQPVFNFAVLKGVAA